MRFEAAELLTTGQCPFNCRYCYIPKTSAMKGLHEDIIKSLEDGSFLDNLEKIAGENLTHLSFWGTEPALTLGVLEKKLQDICSRFPKLREIAFSTSMIMPEPIAEFARHLVPFDKKLEIQVSVDGPAGITDKNRFAGAAEKIPENLFHLLQELQDVPLKVGFRWKATLMIENIRSMNENPSEIDDYFSYFEGLNQRFKEINKSQNISIEEKSFVPSLAVPGKYTSEDGREFALFLRRLREKGYESSYTGRLARLFNYYDELGKKKMFTCSGGDSNIGVGPRLHICHRSFYLDDERYVQSVLEEKDIDNWDISLFRRGTIDLIQRRYAPSVDDELAKMKFDYIMRGYHDFWPLGIAFTKAITKELAAIGQAEERFLSDEDYLTTFALFINTAFSCPMENVLNIGILHYTPLSIIRMCGNGAFAEIVRSIKTN